MRTGYAGKALTAISALPSSRHRFIKGNSLEKVLLETFHNYNHNRLKDYFARGLQIFGMNMSGSRVLLKPNLVIAKAPEKAVTTHPELIKALVEVLLDNKCKITIGDSPGYESTQKVLKISGIMSIIEYYGLSYAHFDKKILIHCNGISPYKRFTFGEDPREYDFIVNLPKLKTHAMMGMTLGVKNTFGFIHSMEKARWHLRAGIDRMLFASILIDIHTLVKPHLTILDGILGMDGEGPTSGRPRNFGIAAMCPSAFALDHCIEKIFRLPYPLPITTLADRHRLLVEYEIIPADIPAIKDLRMPDAMATDWGIPGPLKNLLKSTFVKKPKIRKGKCKKCEVCVKVCPAGALSAVMDETPRFNYKKCIRCYCCQEMCPEGAIKI